MVEVLVALVVLGVGMLGIASLYVITLKSSKSAISRMQAVNLASDIADRIRANNTAGTTYDTGTGNAATKGSDKGCVGATADCTPDDMAFTDLAVWASELTNTLPTGVVGTTSYPPRGTIALTAGTPNIYVITVSWLEPGEGTTPLTYQLTMEL